MFYSMYTIKKPAAKRILKWTALTALPLLTAVLQYPSALTKKKSTQNRGVVLADIPGIVQANPRLQDLLILGSHDSCSDQIGWHSVMDPVEVEKKTPFANPLLMPFIKGVSARFSKAQSCGVTQQLQAGARLIDIRLTWYQGTYYTRHSLISGPFEPYLREILTFLADSALKGEVLLLYFLSAIYPKGEDISHLLRWLREIRVDGKNLFDYVPYEAEVPLRDLSYNTITQNGTTSGAVLLMQLQEPVQEAEYGKLFAIRDNIYAPWANQISSKRIQKFYKTQAAQARLMSARGENQKLHMMQAQKTLRIQDYKDVLWLFKGWSLLDLAVKSNRIIIEKRFVGQWMKGDFQLIIVDNITSCDGNFNEEMNKKVKHYNISKVDALSKK